MAPVLFCLFLVFSYRALCGDYTPIQEEGVSSVEFVGPEGEPLPDENTISGLAWHGGFGIQLNGKQVSL